MCFVVPCLTGNYNSDASVQSNRIARRCFLGASRTMEFEIPPTQLVDRSYPAYKRTGRMPFRNPTNGVGGSFISSLQNDWAHALPESHQRSSWIVHIRGGLRHADRRPNMNHPPTALVGFRMGPGSLIVGWV